VFSDLQVFSEEAYDGVPPPLDNENIVFASLVYSVTCRYFRKNQLEDVLCSRRPLGLDLCALGAFLWRLRNTFLRLRSLRLARTPGGGKHLAEFPDFLAAG
jgi:hypothetical protein